MSKHTPMVVRAARVICKRNSDMCGVDNEDNWKTYGDEWLADAQAALDAAGVPDLLEALNKVNEWCCFASEEDTSARLMALQQIGVTARAAIAKATWSTE